ncbi:MAG: ABC transporter permease [Candidatus Freyarchaeota archaeon]|nr:ABC transporter permease [Candidatus Jordarchaeia archaeon]MBS7268259.1 ABC transporter permease [Candidatus Jordarchaeia archaeon]MBS7279544.1 ABC transporter permease [Candidatus Jordarchaeia archaeon]
MMMRMLSLVKVKLAPFFGSIKRIGALIRKELESLMKDRLALLVIFLLPMIITGAMGMAQYRVTTLDDYYKIAVINQDTTLTAENLSLSNALMNEMYLHANECIVIPMQSYDLAVYLLWQRQINAVLVIPFGFTSQLASQMIPAYVNLTLDGSDVEGQGTIIKGVTNAIAQLKMDYNYTKYEIIPSSQAIWPSETKGISDIKITVPLILPMLLIGAALVITSQSVVGDIPLRRMLLTPAGKSEALIAKTISYLLVSLLQIMIVLGILILLYSFQPVGTLFNFLVVLVLTSFFGISLGLFISVVSNSRLQANQYFIFSYLTLIVILLAVPVKAIQRLDPLQLAREAIASVTARGLTLIDIGQQLLYLFGFSAFFLSLAFIAFFFKKGLV